MPKRLIVLVAAVFLLAACVPPPQDDDSVTRFDPTEAYMGVIQKRGVLRVGIPERPLPPFSFTPESHGVEGTPQGFYIDLATELSKALGVDIEFDHLSDDDLILPTSVRSPGVVDSPVDISFPQVPITERLVKPPKPDVGHPMTHPYYVAHERLLVEKSAGIAQASDLPSGSVVCTILDPQTGVTPEVFAPGAEEVPGSIDTCAEALRHGDAEAVAATDMALMSVWAAITNCFQPCEPSPDYEIVGDEMTTEGYGAMLPVGARGWSNFVDATWAETDAEGRWLRYFDKWCGPYGLHLDEAPTMRVEEAAGLYPL
ncbi:MAG TPA: transporter substrate-binding domain-containing protein [Actinomycetota bacterium]|nr:transporter substrate-binding domain-containing protein [Actinomycetota bacterium]